MGLQPEKCLALENPPPGLQSALAAGMRCIVVPYQGLNNTSFEGAFARFDNLTQAVANLDQLMASIAETTSLQRVSCRY